MDENELIKKIDRAAAPRCTDEIKHEFRHIRPVLENEIFHLFNDRVAASDFSEEKKAGVIEMLIRAMMGVNA
ncbi:MAG: hypothetical protein GX887_02450 [Firmicutes bacterium]|nr:hypothetical protein [Bacillota bacterium]